MHNRESEIWRDVEGAPGYQVSSRGRVRSYVRGSNGRVLSQSLNDKGYPFVSLWINRSARSRPVHVLMAGAFLERTPGQVEVRHLDDVKTNNDLSNLAWGTRSDNTLDCVRNGNHNNARKTRCPQGHSYEEFGRVHTRRSGQKVRVCVQCQREKDALRPLRWQRKTR